jgi:hypothetical protein
MNENRDEADKHIRELVIPGAAMNLRRAIAVLVLASGLAGCGAMDLISKGL